MNDKTTIAKILSNEACCICGRPSDKVCKECLAKDTIACFCPRHEIIHKSERDHIAFWGKLEE